MKDILFLLDFSESAQNNSDEIFYKLKFFFSEIQKNNKKSKISKIAFANLSDRSKNRAIDFIKLEDFEFPESLQELPAADFSSARTFFENRDNSASRKNNRKSSILIIILSENKIQSVQNFMDLCAYKSFLHNRKFVCEVVSKKKAQGELYILNPDFNVVQTDLDYLKDSLKSSLKFLYPKKSKKSFLRKSMGFILRSAFLAFGVVLFFLAITIVGNVIKEKQMAIGVAPAVIFKENPAKNQAGDSVEEIETKIFKKIADFNGEEAFLHSKRIKNSQEQNSRDVILPLREGTTVELVDEYENSAKIRYHDFLGYVDKKFLADGQEEDYKIEGAICSLDYAIACLKFPKLVTANAGELILKASEENSVGAVWKEIEILEAAPSPENQEKIVPLLKKIDETLESAEEVEIRKLIEKFQSAIPESKMYENYKARLEKAESDLNEIFGGAAKRLSEYYFLSDINLSSKYYKRAIEFGVQPDGDYMYNLATALSLTDDEGVFWLTRASEVGHLESTICLAKHYFDEKNYLSSLEYFERAVEQNYKGALAPYFAAILLTDYLHDSDLQRALNYFALAEQADDNSDEYYLACYRLGLCYENGIGVKPNKKTALRYYKKAQEKVPEAKQSAQSLSGWF
ncbi:tetratricopeptide repeat protein [Treponema zioleckii]|uniref:tetratricopeptide repeat protein n=1 Tax=Treponema zioleckii TaxID=331680 RepID=UPI00168B0690|nr:tetratricopeptide repeat protein [Treponema zioleckii]